nr:hypothetical protein [Methylomonas sp. MK1]
MKTGLMISEATSVSAQGLGYPDTPGIWSEEQIDGWTKVTRAVHAAGGRIFLQLWHLGRVSHSDYLNGKFQVSSRLTARERKTPNVPVLTAWKLTAPMAIC